MSKPYHIFAERDAIEPEALEQFFAAMALPSVVEGALMADAHAGYFAPIGAVIATRNMVFPQIVGYDIGCGMLAVPTNFDKLRVERNARRIFDDIYRVVPVGFNHNIKDSMWMGHQRLPKSDMLRDVFAKNGLKQLGSLGGGNHFIEIGHSDQGEVWLIIHSGSRGIGHAAAGFHMRKASDREGRVGFEAGSYEGREYIKDHKFCTEFALTNRIIIMNRVVEVIRTYVAGDSLNHRLINRNHNHVEQRTIDGTKLWIHRKGATHAEAGMLGVIPGDMKNGTFIVRGKGNRDSLFSSSHGAGRCMSRAHAKATGDLAFFKDTMGAVVAKVDESTLDEAPGAYKNIFKVMSDQKDLVDVVCHIKPMINVKA